MSAYRTIALRPFNLDASTVHQYVSEQRQLDSEAVEVTDRYIALTAYADPELPKMILPFAAKDLIVLDKRPFLNKRGDLTKRVEWAVMQDMAELENAWINMPVSYVSIAGQLANVYGTWISHMLSSRFSTSIEDTEIIRVIAGCYYYNRILINTEEQQSPEEWATTNIRFATTKLRMPPRQAELLFQGEWATDINYRMIEGMCHAIMAATDSPAIKFDVATLFTLASTGSWFGSDSDIITQVALEHPPVMASFIRQAQEFNVYRRTRIGQAVNINKRMSNLSEVNSWFKNI